MAASPFSDWRWPRLGLPEPQAGGAERGPVGGLDRLVVQRGPLLIEVRGPGTLVPERVRWISAVTAGRVEKRLAEPGQEVNPTPCCWS